MERKSEFKTVVYRETGTRHIAHNKSCEDYVFRFVAPDGVTCIALSDGAGSYQYAEIGSQITAQTAATFIAKKFNRLFPLDTDTIADYVLHEVLIPLKNAATEKTVDILQFSATLLCVAIHPDGRYLVVHVGDGAIVGLNSNAECEGISIYEHDGPVNLSTFVTVPGTDVVVKKGNGGYASFALMSDGPEEFLVNELGANPRVRLMQQMAFFLDEESMVGQLATLIRLLVDNGMGDDASFAIICNMKQLSAQLLGLSPEFRMMLFSLGQDLSTNKRKRAKQVLDILVDAPGGIPLVDLMRKMHVHSRRIAKGKISFLFDMNLIKRIHGRIYISI